ncbi:hypothetical protein B0T18DRAFT_291841, partial [Schizothecium vesticola]
LANANFDLYVGDDNMLGAGNQFATWYIHQTPPDCNRVNNHARMWDNIDDVSSLRGIRCQGMGCHRNEPENVEVLEMHFSNKPLYHWTIYKDRGHPYQMYGLDGKTYGECIMFPGDTFGCPNAFGGMKSGVRMFRCLTQWTVEDIERA